MKLIAEYLMSFVFIFAGPNLQNNLQDQCHPSDFLPHGLSQGLCDQVQYGICPQVHHPVRNKEKPAVRYQLRNSVQDRIRA